jgi:hypothetical protein
MSPDRLQETLLVARVSLVFRRKLSIKRVKQAWAVNSSAAKMRVLESIMITDEIPVLLFMRIELQRFCVPQHNILRPQ